MKKTTIILTETAILAGVAMILAFFSNTVHPNGIAWVGEWEPEKGVVSAKARNDVVDRTLEIQSMDEIKALYHAGETVFVDARTEEAYMDGHIQGAISLPLFSFDEQLEMFSALVPLSKPIVTYCSGRSCTDSHELAQNLISVGYTNVRIFVDGFPGWEAEGLPIDVGS